MTSTAQNPAISESISPLDAFQGAIPPSKIGLLYRAGLAIVAFAMVLLPAIYMGLIVLTAWGVYYHLTNNITIFEGGSGRGSIVLLILYLGPAIAGIILVAFMIKPFFARQAKGPEPLILEPTQEPLLFAFVEKICQLVGAPVPSGIAVDCQVNASASLRRGLLSKDLVLTIGLPLASGLTMREFAGVLAHEFGHFAQGAGMRLTYVIRKINFWFARVVYERDSWDVQLEHAARNSDLRIGIVLHAARACVWLTRRILWALMLAGHAISCFMLRQMEYDADSYEAKLAGSDSFESTAARLQVLNVAAQCAYGDVRQAWSSSRLPENLPLLINHRAGSLPPDVHEKLTSSSTSATTGWFDTHPCDADRIRAARALNQPGAFRLTEPATGLFADFPALSRAVTLHQYQKHFELDFTDQNLVPTDEMLRESSATAEAEAMLRKFYGEVNISLVPLLADSDLIDAAPDENLIAQWQEARQAAAELREQAEKLSGEWHEAQLRLVNAHTVYYLTKAGFEVKTEEFNLPQTASLYEQETAALAGIQEHSAIAADRVTQLAPFMNALRRRVAAALRAAQLTPDFARAAEASNLSQLGRLLAAVGAELPRVHEISSKLPAFTSLAQNRANHSDGAVVDRILGDIGDDMQKIVAGLQERLASFPYPFPHARGPLSVAEYARSEKPSEHLLQRTYFDADAHVDRLVSLHFRVLGQILALANAAENKIESSEVSSAHG
jgi:Zn-dependent protease with chaperone function